MAQPAQVISRSPLIGYATVGVQPPSQYYLSPDDHLFLRVWNSAAGVTVTLRYRYLQPRLGVLAGTIPLTPSTDRTANFLRVPLAEGFLLSVALQTSAGTPRRGQTFCQVGIVRGGELADEPAALLISDYLHDTLLLAWPGGLLRSSVEGPGVLRSITGTDQAAGAEISETVPTNARWRFYSLVASLVTSAAVANRFPNIAFDDGANVHARVGSNTAQAASLTRAWAFSGAPLIQALSGTALIVVGAPEIYLAAGHRIRTITENFQAGDNWGAPQFLVEEWIEE
jgi:hypothetical protein